MIDRTPLRYEPDYVSPPGESLKEMLDSVGMSQAALAARTGRSPKTINEIVKGKAPITPQVAIQFERVLGVPTSFWMNFERNYRESLARADERTQLEKQVQWLKQFPLRQMIEFRWVREFKDRVSQVQELLDFFGVASPDQWNELWRGRPAAAFRESSVFQSKPEAVAAWLRQGEIEGRRIETCPFNKARFREKLTEARHLTSLPPDAFKNQLVPMCAECGVAVVLVHELKGVSIHGATRWLTPDKALIQLSLRYKNADQLWFSFFHEAGHILLHGKRRVFLDTDKTLGEHEEEANAFACDLLIPPKEFSRFVADNGYISKEAIISFAKSVGIAPGIVVGRLQHEKRLPYTHCNDLKVALKWADV